MELNYGITNDDGSKIATSLRGEEAFDMVSGAPQGDGRGVTLRATGPRALTELDRQIQELCATALGKVSETLRF